MGAPLSVSRGRRDLEDLRAYTLGSQTPDALRGRVARCGVCPPRAGEGRPALRGEGDMPSVQERWMGKLWPPGTAGAQLRQALWGAHAWGASGILALPAPWGGG